MGSANERTRKLEMTRNFVLMAEQSVGLAIEALMKLDPCFEELRADLDRVRRELEAKHRELNTYVSAARVMGTVGENTKAGAR